MRQYLFKAIMLLLLCNNPACMAYGNNRTDSIATDTITLETKADTIRSMRLNSGAAQTTPYDTTATRQYLRRVGRIQRGWNAIVPNLSIFQYAGGIGMFSIGTGWDYGRRNQWETYLMLGYTPRHNTPDEYYTLSLKETYTPWAIPLWKNAQVSPLFVTLTVSTLLNGEFWVKNPSRYPSGYYSFSSKIRTHIGLGQKIRFSNLQRRSHWFKDVALYYEVSSCDMYIFQKIRNKSIPLGDIICLAVGIQYTIF
ncbi:MAG: hypothetical protein ACI3Y5_09360 [Prevotella sp.]